MNYIPVIHPWAMQSMFKFAPDEFIASLLNKTKSDHPCRIYPTDQQCPVNCKGD